LATLVGPSICLATWADEKYCNWVVVHQKARARHLGFVRSSLKPICFFWGSHPHFCLTSLLALQRRQKNKLSLLAAGSFYNTHHNNGKHLLTYLPWLFYRSEGLPCWPDPQEQACLANYETSVYGSSIYILPLAHSVGFPDMWAHF
jgi:hypothetical protein